MANTEEIIQALDPHDPRFSEDGSLESVMTELREKCPVARTEAHGGAYVLTRYRDVLNVVQEWRTFTSAEGIMIPRSEDAVLMIPGECDGPLHRQYRRAFNPLLTRGVVDKYMPGMRAVARELLARLGDQGEADIVRAFTDPYPRLVFFRHLLGVPDAELPEVLGHIFAIKEPKDSESAGRAWAGFSAYIAMICERREAEAPRGDLLDGVIRAEVDGRPITRDESVRALMQLTFGGLGTTSAGLANIMRRLAENPDLQNRLRLGRLLLPKAIEELIRYDTIAVVMARTTTHDVEIEHIDVPAGEKVLIYYAGANRDPREFIDPDKIDIDRVSNRHLAFGAGPHRCIGSNLARLQILVAVEEVLDKLQSIRIAPNNEFHFHSGFSRGLTSLKISFEYS